jgi:hypothetical protein
MHDMYRSRPSQLDVRPFDRDDYRRTGRFSTFSLESDYRATASELVLPLARATTQDRYDPFS